MEVKYTDIDYFVFTDAAKYIYKYGKSPYSRETYRYTPLLAYLLVPTAIKFSDSPILNTLFFSFGKLVFVISDLITGLIILELLEYLNDDKKQESNQNWYRNLALSSIWLLNPMVITISTRGSSESFLTVLIMLSLYFLIIKKSNVLSAIFLGLSIHYKLYPIIYLPSILLYLTYKDFSPTQKGFKNNIISPIINNLPTILTYTFSTIGTFGVLGYLMYSVFEYEFLFNSYLYHFIRTDHRHNFSIYNISLYFRSSIENIQNNKDDIITWILSLDFAKFAFIPQILISGILIPAGFWFNFNFSSNSQNKKSLLLLITLFLQTFSFVNYNKVITSQYFIWYLVLLPFYLKDSRLLNAKKVTGIICLGAWVLGQGLWLFNAYNLEFLGLNTFYPGLFFSSVIFFLSNTWILGTFIDDVFKTFFYR